MLHDAYRLIWKAISALSFCCLHQLALKIVLQVKQR